MEKEVRRIDANKLESKLQEHHDFFVDGVGGFRFLSPKDKARVDEITNCIAEVCNAPTVDAVEVCYCDNCVNHGNCLPEDIFRMVRIEKPYCCAGKVDGDTNA